jgi:hypothetical protein
VGPSSFRKDIPPELSAIIVKALAKEPAGRHADANTMLAALRPWILRGSDPRISMPMTPAMTFEGAKAE